MHSRPVSTHGDGLVGIVLKRHHLELARRYDSVRILDRVGKRVSNAARTKGCSTRSREPTRTSMP